MNYWTCTITEIEHLQSGYALLRFSADEAITGEPGQFVMVRGDWGDHPILPRAFSLVETGPHGAILVRAVGTGTEKLVQMKPGDKLFVMGPCGRGYKQPTSRRPVLVAGGVGVAPLLFLADRIDEKTPRPVFVYGAQTSADLVLTDRLQSLASLELITEDGSCGETGLVTAPLARLLNDGVPSEIYACGPTGMLSAVAQIAMRAGTDCEIAFESPMACGMGTCKGCAIHDADGQYRYVCSDGPVFDARQIYGGTN